MIKEVNNLSVTSDESWKKMYEHMGCDTFMDIKNKKVEKINYNKNTLIKY